MKKVYQDAVAYVAPTLEVIEVEVECGFAATGNENGENTGGSAGGFEW